MVFIRSLVTFSVCVSACFPLQADWLHVWLRSAAHWVGAGGKDDFAYERLKIPTGLDNSVGE